MVGFDGVIAGFNSTAVFVIVLSILIVVHEWGHFITAKWCGIRVSEFALGFGPTLYQKEYNGTQYMLKAFPLGGYVRMAGDERDKCSGAHDEFYSKAPWKRALVVLNGPVINFILAYISFCLVFLMGYPGLSTEITEVKEHKAAYAAGLQSGDQIVAVDNKKLYGWLHYERLMEGENTAPVELTIKRDEEYTQVVVTPEITEKTDLIGQNVFYRDIGIGFLPSSVGTVVEGKPAALAGLQRGDLVKRINGKNISDWTTLQETIAASTSDMLKVVVERDHRLLTFEVEPFTTETLDKEGNMKTVRQIGIGPSQEFSSFQFGIGDAVQYAWEELSFITVLTYKALGRMVTGAMKAKESVTGPVGIFYIVKGAAEEGLVHIIFILGVISASLAIFNLLPILPLDGGHLFLLAIEQIRGKALPEKVDDFFARLGLTFILLLALFVFYSDFDNFGIFDAIGKLFQTIKGWF